MSLFHLLNKSFPNKFGLFTINNMYSQAYALLTIILLNNGASQYLYSFTGICSLIVSQLLLACFIQKYCMKPY